MNNWDWISWGVIILLLVGSLIDSRQIRGLRARLEVLERDYDETTADHARVIYDLKRKSNE